MWMFVALVGTDMQNIIDMLEEMFGEGLLVDPKKFLTAYVKAKFEVARAKEETLAEAEGELDPSKETVIYPTSLPIMPDFGIDPNLLPETTVCTEKIAKTGKSVDKFYYRCHICKNHSSQNRPSMCTHTQKCLNVKLRCPLCKATYDSTEYLQNHVSKIHGGNLDHVGQREAKTTIAGLASTSQTN